MTRKDRHIALTKLAFFGPAQVQGAPAFAVPPLTAGQVLYGVGNPAYGLPPWKARAIANGIVRSGVDVNSPARKLINAGIGALAGNFVSNMLGAGPFGRGLATAIGASYGYNN
jgi:hypothetical protein